MGKILGIDYGKSKIGVSVGDTDSKLAEPLIVLRVKNSEDAVRRLKEVVQEQEVERIVLGVSEGEMAKDSLEFGKKLQNKLKTAVLFQDETLTTKEAQRLSRKAGVGRKKRKEMEDAYSATLILQNFMDTKLNP